MARASRAHEDEPDFDLDAELEALERMGYVFPLPVVDRAMQTHRVVRAVGWQGAQDLLNETWAGWEADFLPEALAMLSEADLASEYRTQAQIFLGGGRRA